MKRQQGMALLVVLLLLAVMVTMASSMTQRFRMEWQRTYNQQLQLQNYWYLLGSETLIYARSTASDLLTIASQSRPDVAIGDTLTARFPSSSALIFGADGKRIY